MALSFLKFTTGRSAMSLCWRAVLSLSVGAMLFASAPASAEDQVAALAGVPFNARDAMKQINKPDLSGYGLDRVTVAYENSLWPAGASKLQPDTNYIAKSYIPKIKNSNPDVVIIDIETWKLRTYSTATEVSEFITKFKKVISVFRTNLPNTKIGVYLWMPERNWLAPCGDPKKRVSRTASWHNRNLRLQPLADAVDIIVPSLYTFYGDAASIACWPNYAKANIAEARIFGKPVWAFLWMKYHTDHTKYIPTAFWRTQLETVYSLADGFVLWSKSGAETWSSTTPWWVETKNFLAAKGLNN
jgi:hypothetical protein